MTRDVTIAEMSLNRTESFVDVRNSFAFRKDRPMKWLQKLCLWVLLKLGAHAVERKVVITRTLTPEAGRKIVAKCREQYRDVQRQFNMKPKQIFMGCDQWQEFTGEMLESAHPFNFDFDRLRGYDGEFQGMMIRVIPWMNGVLVTP